MRNPFSFARRLRADTRGATAVEYGLIIACVVLVLLGALQSVASVNTGIWNNISNQVISAH